MKQILYASEKDINKIKFIADKNKKYIGFVMKLTLLEAIKEN